MVENSVKYIYNTYLRISRSSQGKPFKYRQNFVDFEKDEKYIQCLKLKSFFDNNPAVKIDLFFEAPFKSIEDFSPSLNFYLSRKAISCYTSYLQKLNDLPPDNEYHISAIKNGIKFIGNFCKENNITLEQYRKHKKDYLPSWLIHLKYKEISIYNLMYFENFRDELFSIEKDILELYIPQIFHKYNIYKMQFIKSKKAKKLVDKGTFIYYNKTRSNTAPLQ